MSLSLYLRGGGHRHVPEDPEEDLITTAKENSSHLKTRIPSLDGLRGLSILAVITSHAAYHFLQGSPTFGPVYRTLSSVANYGVDVFFVISGYLITGILMKNKARNGAISLRAFYQRRAVRIMPLALVYIAVISILGHPSKVQFFYAITFSTSFFFEQAYRGLQQLWSLSVEEQFYLFWPLGFLATSRRTKHFAWAVVIVCPILRIALQASGYSHFWHAGPMIADTLMAGCLLALYEPELQAFTRRYLSSAWSSAALWAASVILFCFARGGYASCLLWFALPALIALGICSSVVREERLLNVGPLPWIGLLSYSLYLWQQPFLVFRGPYDTPLLRLAGIVAAAVLSYCLIERRTLALASRIRRKKAVPLEAIARGAVA
jgi:peptidoglycan/LPS O-acetylase OafA/YrhL